MRLCQTPCGRVHVVKGALSPVRNPTTACGNVLASDVSRYRGTPAWFVWTTLTWAWVVPATTAVTCLGCLAQEL